jgi:hypothetical protein
MHLTIELHYTIFILQLPGYKGQCAFLSVMAQFQDVPANMHPQFVRRAVLINFAENVEEIVVCRSILAALSAFKLCVYLFLHFFSRHTDR